MKTGERFNQSERTRLVMLELLLHAEWLDKHLGRFPCSAEIAAREFLGLPQLPMPDGSDPLAAPLPAPAAAPEPVVCARCNDTHRMALRDHEVPCTACPLPCNRCRMGGSGAYCTTTPCACACHGRAAAAPVAAEFVEAHRG